ncbi:MAG: hypothetical protein RH949_05975 [Coleofasciculus sp. A1-SPW-01]|nr:hypothetical protein [Coleofasciculus chthonoplastes]
MSHITSSIFPRGTGLVQLSVFPPVLSVKPAPKKRVENFCRGYWRIKIY